MVEPLVGEVSVLADAGFIALWLPLANKAANIDGMSMVYDVYDTTISATSIKRFRQRYGSDPIAAENYEILPAAWRGRDDVGIPREQQIQDAGWG
jgi:hypothetical protein